MLARATTMLVLPVALLAACENSRTPVRSLSQPAAPAGFRTLGYPTAGVALQAPTNWSGASDRAPLVTTISSGAAVAALWRFSRSSRPPTGAGALTRARSELIAAARARDASLHVIRSTVASIDRAPAIELDATERIGGQPRRVRSTHLFTAGAELVLEQYAPSGMFHAVDHAVFSPMKHSLRLPPAGLAAPAVRQP